MRKSVFMAVILILAFCFQANAQTCSTAPNGLVSWYKAEGNALDSNSGFNGTLQNGATYAGGKVGQAFSFDGNDDKVFVPHNASLNVANVTLEAWVFPAAFGGQGSIINKRTAVNNAGYGLEPTAGGNLTFFIYIGGNLFFVTSPSPMLLNTWSHVAGTFDGSVLKIFVNGTQVASQNISGSIDATTGDLVIGENIVNGTNWTGLIDEPTIYNRALSASDIQTIFNSGTAGKCISPTPSSVGLVSWWSGDNNTLDSRSRNNGTLQNGATYAGGKVGQAFSLDGITQYVSAPASSSLDVGYSSNGITIEGWIRPTDLTVARPIAEWSTTGSSSGSVGVHLYASVSPTMNGQGNLYVNFRVGNVDKVIYSPINALTVNTFQHIAATYDKVTGNASLYINGTAVTLNGGTSTTVNLGLFNPNTSGNLYLGARVSNENGDAGLRFAGQLDEIDVYNRQLSTKEIQDIVNAGSLGKAKPTATTAPNNLVSWWSGDGNANDIAGTSNGTIQGNVTYSTGKISQSFQLGGTGDLSGNGDRVNIGNPTNLQLQDFTIETWIKRSNSTIVTNSPFPGTAGGTFFAYGQNGYGFVIDQNTNRLALTNVGNSAVFSNLTVTDTNWHHVAVTKSGNQTVFYVDGVSDTQTYSTAFGFTTNAAIGARGDNNVQNAFFGAIDELAIYNRDLTTNEIQSIFNAGIAGKLKDKTTPTGANIEVNTKSDATVTFPTVSTAGITQQIPLDLSLLPSLPSGSTSLGLTADIATSATFTGLPTVCFNLPSITNLATFNNLRIAHLENNVWTNRTDLASINFATKTICTSGLTSLSPFAVVNGFAPSAANAAISGRITTSQGAGIRGVNVSVVNSNGATFSSITGTFGYYRFENMPVGETYILSVRAKRYSFANPTRVINLNDELTSEDFVADGK